MLRLPDLDHCKLAVLNSLPPPASRCVLEYAIDPSSPGMLEPRLAFNRIVNTINQQPPPCAGWHTQAADSGLLSPELAAGISRVKRSQATRVSLFW